MTPPLSARQWQMIQAHLGLPEQEMRVLQGIAAGLTDTGIERALGISHGTLRTYMDRIFQRCGTRSRVGVIMKALEPLIAPTPK